MVDKVELISNLILPLDGGIYNKQSPTEQSAGTARVMDKLYKISEVAEMFGVSGRTVQNWMAGRGVDIALSCQRISRRTTRITESDLTKFMLDNKVEANVPVALGKRLREARALRELQAAETNAILNRFYPNMYPAPTSS